MKGMQPEWVASIIEWARDDDRVAAVFVFGSRAKGTHRDNSDLDLAVLLTEDEQDTAAGYAIYKGDEMRVRLASAIRLAIHLHFPSTGDTVVWPAVQDHGQLIYSG